MASISGQLTSNIDQIDGFFTDPGPVPESVISGTGVQLTSTGTLNFNPSITPDFNLGPVENHVFSQVAVQQQQPQIIGIKSDGTLWYYALNNTYGLGMFTTLGAWTQYGTDTDWEYVTASSLNWGFIKGGSYYFMGYGSYGMAGDGTTNSPTAPTLTSSALSFSKVSFGQSHAVLLTTTGEVYTCGQNFDYGTGLGVNSGTTLNLTRESASLTGVTDIGASYRTTRIITGGNIYSTGKNDYNHAGPLIASTASINGPTLGYNGGDIDKIFVGRDFSIGLTSTGEARHAGFGNGRRVDNGIGNFQGYTGQLQEQYTLLTAGGTGWTDFSFPNASSGGQINHYGIKNGEVYFSSDVTSAIEAWGITGPTYNYNRVGTFSTATAAAGSYVSGVYPRNSVISVS